MEEVGPEEDADRTGTTIHYTPDETIFNSLDYDFDNLVGHFKQVAYLNKGLEVSFISHWHARERDGDIERSYYFEGGLTGPGEEREPAQESTAGEALLHAQGRGQHHRRGGHPVQRRL